MLGIRVKWTDRIRLVSYEVIESVSSGGINKAISDPFRRFNSARDKIQLKGAVGDCFFRITYASDTSAMTSKASSTPSSVISAPCSSLAL
jgi:hypothetical protein